MNLKVVIYLPFCMSFCLRNVLPKFLKLLPDGWRKIDREKELICYSLMMAYKFFGF